MSTSSPVIICGATARNVQSEIEKSCLIELLKLDKLAYADWSGTTVIGVPVYNTCYINEEEFSSDISGALELFKRRTGIVGAVFVCTNFLTSVI